MSTINDLPNEILIKILSYIHIDELQHLPTVCKQWKSIIEIMLQTLHKSENTQNLTWNVHNLNISTSTTTKNEITTIDDLPNEMLNKIFSYFKIEERQRLVTVSKRWRRLIERMWRSVHKLTVHNCPQAAWPNTKIPSIFCRNYIDMCRVRIKFASTSPNMVTFVYRKRAKWASEEVYDFLFMKKRDKSLLDENFLASVRDDDPSVIRGITPDDFIKKYGNRPTRRDFM